MKFYRQLAADSWWWDTAAWLFTFRVYTQYVRAALALERAVAPLRPKLVTVKSTCPPSQRSVRGGRRK